MLALVSSPPTKTPSARPARSTSLIASPWSRMRSPSRPSPGRSRCRAVDSSRKRRDSETAPKTPWPPCVTSNLADTSARRSVRSSSGSPSSSQITRNGTGNANSLTRSTSGPCASMAARRRSTISRIVGRRRSRRRIVNWGVSSRRSRVCSGGSVNPSPPMSPSAAEPWGPVRGRMSLLKPCSSASTARASAGPVTSQTVMPRNEVSRCTGSRDRTAASRGTGSRPSRCNGQVSRAGTRSRRERSTLRRLVSARTPRRPWACPKLRTSHIADLLPYVVDARLERSAAATSVRRSRGRRDATRTRIGPTGRSALPGRKRSRWTRRTRIRAGAARRGVQ